MSIVVGQRKVHAWPGLKIRLMVEMLHLETDGLKLSFDLYEIHVRYIYIYNNYIRINRIKKNKLIIC